MWGFFRKIKAHPVKTAIVFIVLMFIPSIESCWSLFSDQPMIPTIAKKIGIMDMPNLDITKLLYLSVPLGLFMLGYIIYLTKTDKQKLLLTLTTYCSGTGQNEIKLQPVDITNQSEKNMSLSFKLGVSFVDNDGHSKTAWFGGIWKDFDNPHNPDRAVVKLNKESSERGTLFFKLPKASIMGLPRWNIDIADQSHVLEIYDRISGIRTGGHPCYGYPLKKEPPLSIIS